MHPFSTLMLRASESFGAPAYLARALGCTPRDVYSWIAGVEQPGPAERQQLERRLQGALARKSAPPVRQRRWADRAQLAETA